MILALRTFSFFPFLKWAWVKTIKCAISSVYSFLRQSLFLSFLSHVAFLILSQLSGSIDSGWHLRFALVQHDTLANSQNKIFFGHYAIYCGVTSSAWGRYIK